MYKIGWVHTTSKYQFARLKATTDKENKNLGSKIPSIYKKTG